MYGYSRRKPVPTICIPVRTGCGIAAANSLRGAPPRNRYIGLSSELPTVIRGRRRPVGLEPPRDLDRLVEVQARRRTPSSMFSLAMIAMRPPTASRTAGAVSRASRARFSSDPP